jgi:hypothetical protein
MKSKVVVIIVILILSACKFIEKRLIGFDDVDGDELSQHTVFVTPQSGASRRIEIDSLDRNSSLYLPDVIDTMYGIKLENHPHALLGSIEKIVVKDDAFYIFDKHQTKSLKKFDRHGKFLTSFGTSGRGSGQYFQLTDFSVTANEVIMYDQFRRVLLFYDLDGNFIRERAVPFFATAFHVLENGMFVFHTVDADNYHLPKLINYSLHWVDSSFTFHASGAYREKDKYRTIPLKNNMNVFNGRLYFHAPYQDTVYYVSPDGKMEIEYIFQLPNTLPYHYTLSKNSKAYDTEVLQISPNAYIEFRNSPVVADDFLVTYFSLGYEHGLLIYSNKTGNARIFNGRAHQDNHLFFNPLANVIGCEGNTLIGYNMGAHLLERVQIFRKENSYHAIPEAMKEFYRNINLNDNLVLVFYKLKEF